MRLLAIELLLITGLSALAVYALWDFASWKALLVSAFALCVAIYLFLQFLGRSRMAFRVAAVLTVLPHAAGIWAHNSLEWYRFLGVETSFGTGRPQFWTAAMFMLALAGLVALYRVIGLRGMGRELSSRGVDGPDRRAVVLNEGITLAALIGAGLVLALITAQAGSVLGRIESMPDMLSSAVLPIGGGAAIIFAYCVTLWFRSHGGTGDAGASLTEDGTENGTEDGSVVEPDA